MSDSMIESRILPANFGPLKGANANARVKGPCGDTMEFWLLVEDDIVRQATYTTDGCSASIICGSVAASLAEGIPLSEVISITPEQVLDLAWPVPEDSHHCALLAVNTLKATAANYKK